MQPGALLATKTLVELRAETSDFDWVATAVVRDGHTIVARGDTTIDADDHVLLMVTAEHVDEATRLIGVGHREVRRVIVLGSTRLAELTADLIVSEGLDVAVVDPDPARCRRLAETHTRTLIVHGDPSDPNVLRDLGIKGSDMVLALTGWDEVNVVACLIAKALGASTTVARFNRIAYVGLLAGHGIDATVSARLLAANAILRFVRRGRIHSVATFKDTDAEALEVETAASSPAIGKSLTELSLPKGAIIGGILREGRAFVPTGNTAIQARDRLITFALPEAIKEVERLFAE